MKSTHERHSSTSTSGTTPPTSSTFQLTPQGLLYRPRQLNKEANASSVKLSITRNSLDFFPLLSMSDKALFFSPFLGSFNSIHLTERLSPLQWIFSLNLARLPNSCSLCSSAFTFPSLLFHALILLSFSTYCSARMRTTLAAELLASNSDLLGRCTTTRQLDAQAVA